MDNLKELADFLGNKIDQLNQIKKPMVSESIFSNGNVVIPMADVQHIEKHWYPSDERTRDNYRGIKVITKHTRWDMEADTWANNIYLDRQEGDAFLKAWCFYRSELEGISSVGQERKVLLPSKEQMNEDMGPIAMTNKGPQVTPLDDGQDRQKGGENG